MSRLPVLRAVSSRPLTLALTYLLIVGGLPSASGFGQTRLRAHGANSSAAEARRRLAAYEAGLAASATALAIAPSAEQRKREAAPAGGVNKAAVAPITASKGVDKSSAQVTDTLTYT